VPAGIVDPDHEGGDEFLTIRDQRIIRLKLLHDLLKSAFFDKAEMIHALLPVYLVTIMGASMTTVAAAL
jgi:hypothetical protein